MGQSETYVVNSPNRLPPKQRTIQQKVLHFIYSKEKGTFCGRSCKNWGLISVFYLVFYGCLAGMFCLCMYVGMSTVPYDTPKYYINNGMGIFTEPGMSFLPQDEASHFEQVQSVTFTLSKPASYAPYVKQLREYLLNVYRNDSDHHTSNCDSTTKASACDLSLVQFEPECWDSNDPDNFQFGYDVGSPCVMLRINKMYSWEPEEYTSSPDGANLGGRWQSGSLPLKCDDFRVKMSDPLYTLTNEEYVPSSGFPVSCYPYCSRQTTYHSSIVMVKFHNLTRSHHVPIECHFYAKNVIHDRKLGTGSASFIIHIEN